MSHESDISGEESLPIEWPQTPDEAAQMIRIYQGILARIAQSNGLPQTVEMLMHCADLASEEAAAQTHPDGVRIRLAN